MKIGVLSDTHIRQPDQLLPRQLVKDFSDADLIIHCGDWVELSVLNQLTPLAEVKGVFGNMDHHSITTNMPEVLELELEGFQLGVTHGWGPPAGLENRLPKKFAGILDLIIYGHTHEAVFHRKDNIWFLNPGSPTDTNFADRQTYAILTLDDEINAEIKELG
jgi:hypothetical protein